MNNHHQSILTVAIVLSVIVLTYFTSITEAQTQGKTWVFLVAGSNGYQNYRHQSDIYHAYQVFTKKGVPAENIIVMHYDDIADARENPTPGTVINVPNGPNVYPGVPLCWKGCDSKELFGYFEWTRYGARKEDN
jgi:legumain